MSNMKPAWDRYLIEKLPPEEKTEGGLFIKASTTDRTERGVVIEAGLGMKNEGYRFQLHGHQGVQGPYYNRFAEKGDTVIFMKNTGIEVRDGVKTYYILDEKDIIAKI